LRTMASLSWRQQHSALPSRAQCASCWRQDKLAIVRKFGRLDYFVTITCDPKWPEITAELLPGQATNDRPDLADNRRQAQGSVPSGGRTWKLLNT